MKQKWLRRLQKQSFGFYLFILVLNGWAISSNFISPSRISHIYIHRKKRPCQVMSRFVGGHWSCTGRRCRYRIFRNIDKISTSTKGNKQNIVGVLLHIILHCCSDTKHTFTISCHWLTKPPETSEEQGPKMLGLNQFPRGTLKRLLISKSSAVYASKIIYKK